jgi:uncharacterized membrane protein YhiD involved in acid resistance
MVRDNQSQKRTAHSVWWYFIHQSIFRHIISTIAATYAGWALYLIGKHQMLGLTTTIMVAVLAAVVIFVSLALFGACLTKHTEH